MATKSYNTETKTWTFDSGIATHTLTLDELNAAMQDHGLGHGILQKVGDSYAGAAKAVEDTDMTVEEYIDQCIVGSLDQLRNGDWNLRSGGSAGPRVTDLARALAEAYGVSETEAAEKISDMDADTKKAVRKHPAIEPILARLRAERAAQKEKELSAKAQDVELPDLF